MADAIRHYEELLARYYSWMIGMPFEEKVAEQRALLEELGLRAGSHGKGLDLGCGPGYQAAALADLGFDQVVAIDTSQALLEEATAHRNGRPIELVLDDLRHFARYAVPGGTDAILCMGDTLTHLKAPADVEQLFVQAFRALSPGGRLVLTFRDFSRELSGLDRFIPVRADAERQMICFLEYEPETVLVHDLIHRREGETWSLRKSCYRKLRLAPDAVAEQLGALGFAVEVSRPSGRLWAICARKRDDA